MTGAEILAGRELERAVDAAERAFVAEEMTAVLRHDVRNKLSAIRNAAFYVKRRFEGSPIWNADQRIAPFFEIIETELGAANGLIGERLVFTRALGASPRAIDLGVVVGRALDVASHPSVVAPRELATVPPVIADPVEVALIVRCLMENAIEASPPDRPIRVTLAAEGRHVALAIADEGPGAPADLDELIASGSVPQRPGHLGIGLRIVHRIATRQNARLSIDRPERGTVAKVVWSCEETPND